MRLFLDQDGVLANFDKALEERGVKNEGSFIHLPKEQWTPAQVDLDRRVREVMIDPEFWRSIPPMPDAFQLWDYCNQFNHEILTAVPNETPIRAEIEQIKRWWISYTFGPFYQSHIHVCLRRHKQLFASPHWMEGETPPHILIDDMKANCDEWTAAGGIAIHHVSAMKSIEQLREIIHE